MFSRTGGSKVQRYRKYLVTSLVLLISAFFLLLKAQFSGPTVNRWSQAANLVTARSQACSVLLQDGRVLVAGGNTANGVANTVEVFSQNGSFLTAAPMLTPRADASCSVLADGKVFVTGGTDGAKTLASSELYDADANVWAPAGSMGG